MTPRSLASGHMARGHTTSGHVASGHTSAGRTRPAPIRGPHTRRAARPRGHRAGGHRPAGTHAWRRHADDPNSRPVKRGSPYPRRNPAHPGGGTRDGTGRNGRAAAHIWGADTRGQGHGRADTGGTDTGGVDTVGERTGLILGGQEILDGPPHTLSACPPPPAGQGTARYRRGGAMFPGSWPVTARNPAGASSSWGAGWTSRFGRATAVRRCYLMNSGGTRGGQCPTVSMPREWARATRAARLGALSFRSMSPTWYSTPCRLR